MAPPTTTETSTELSTQKKLLIQRNKKLMARFDELYNAKRKRLDDVLSILEQEFFISERTIRGIMKEASEERLPQAGEQFTLFT